jgi:hypothetical protein
MVAPAMCRLGQDVVPERRSCQEPSRLQCRHLLGASRGGLDLPVPNGVRLSSWATVWPVGMHNRYPRSRLRMAKRFNKSSGPVACDGY